MGFFERAAQKSELRVMSQLDREFREHAPHIPVQTLHLPCHIISEWHTGIGVTFAGGSAGIYRCQGHFWSVPLTETELWQATIGMRTSNPPAAARTMTPKRQDLGLMASGGTMSLVLMLIAAPHKLVVGDIRARQQSATAPPPRQAPSPQPAHAPQSAPAAARITEPAPPVAVAEPEPDEYGASGEQAYWDDLNHWYENVFPETREGRMAAAFGVQAENRELSGEATLIDADAEHGIELYNSSGHTDLFVYLHADEVRPPAGWKIELRRTAETEDGHIEYAREMLDRWFVAPLTLSPGELAVHVKDILQRLTDVSSPEVSRALRGALITWTALTLDATTAVDGLRAVEDDDEDIAGTRNAWAIAHRLKTKARLTAEQRDYLDEWDTDD
jgi:hypothetical protein